MRFISNQLLVKFRREKVIGGITAIARVTANDFCNLAALKEVGTATTDAIEIHSCVARSSDSVLAFVKENSPFKRVANTLQVLFKG